MGHLKEQWSKIPEFANYEISNFGEIFRVCKTKRTPVKVSSNKGYLYASLSYAPNKSKQVNVKHLLDLCFEDHIYKDSECNDLEGEIWKDVVGWEDSHEVSNLGRIRTKARIAANKSGSESHLLSRLKKTYFDGDGYERVCLYADNKSKLLGVHRIVAEAFLPNPSNLPQVNHKNGIKADNSPENLEWVTGPQNIQHSIELGLRDPSCHRRSVVRLSDGKVFSSIADLHREIGGCYNEIVYKLKQSDPEPTEIAGQEYNYYN